MEQNTDDENKKKKIYICIGIAVLIVLLVISYFVFFRSSKTEESQKKGAFPTEAVIPTVDSSVIVKLAYKIKGQEVTLTINGIPKGTESLEYSLEYDTQDKGIQGVIGEVELDIYKKSYEKDLILGTCSSGRCMYHTVVGSIIVSIKFTGDYGEKIFEDEFTLWILKYVKNSLIIKES